jgi:hypothetical protein
MMGMGTAPCHAWAITLDGLKAICPKEVKACETALKAAFGVRRSAALDCDWDKFALGIQQEQFDDLPDGTGPESMVKAWEKLQAAFKRNTTVGKSHLELGIGHYSSDDGDRYDEIGQGCYFTVDNVTDFTPAGEKFRVHLEEKNWTVFG